jgi:hypothetical protein
MNPIVIDIPGVGPVEFPATMSQDEINMASKKLHDEANKEPVVEKESPEAFGGIGTALGAVVGAGDVIYSKGRPLFRIAEKAMGMDSGAPAVKPRTFLDPSTVAEQAIARRMPTDVVPEGSTTTVRNWTVGKPGAGTGQFGGQEFLGGENYKEANKIAEAALEAEKKFPGTKVMPGSLLSVPEEESKRLAQQKAALAAEQDKINQAQVGKVAQTRAERLGERSALKGQENKFNMAKGAGSLGVKVAAPVLGGYEAGSQGAQAYNRLTRPDLTAGDAAAGATNIVGAGAGALSMVPSKYRIPAAIIAQGAGAIANFLDKRNPRNEEVEQKAAGGLAGYADGGGPKLPGKFGKAASALGTALKPLARAPAKSKAEIEAIAQRMAPQEMGEFVRAPGKTTSVSGASKKQYDRELGLQHDIRNVVGTQGLPEIDYHKRIGDVAMMLPGDKSIVGDIHRVGDLQLEKAVRAEGGKGFPVNYALENPNVPPELWTSTGQVAKNYQNLGRKVSQEYGAENVLPHYANMPMGMGYSQHFADTLLRGLRPAGADLGKATDMMRTGSFKGKSFPDFPGFENMDEVYEMMKHNPELRQLFTNRIQVQNVAKGLGLPPTYGSDALHAVTSPSLRNLETGAGGQMIGRLDLERQMSPSTHKGYIPDRDLGLNIPGEAIARTSHATPYEMLYPDLLNDIRTNPITYENKTGKAMIVPEFGRLKMDSPRQVIDPQFADEMAMYKEAMKKLTGKAAGGSINMEELQTRKSALPDISLSARDLPNMTGQPGVGHMQTPQGAIARLQLEKELEKARLRAGVSGVAMSIPGMHGVRTMPGQMDVGANIPVGRGNLDISARRSINPIPGRGHEQGVNARYTMPFAEGGEVQHFQVGGMAKLAKHVHSQNPKVAQALEEYLKGNISQEERIRIMNQFLPTRQWKDLPPNYSDEQIRNALMSNKQEKALAPVPAGMRVGNRLDIPAYTQNGVYVDTTHALTGGKSPISYNRTGHLTDVDFSSKPDKAVRVGLGTQPQALTPMAAQHGADKSPFALIQGTNVGTKDDEVRRMMAEMMKDPRYTQIGMDPRKHSQFYDKSTGMPVFSAEEKLQSGPLIIAPKKGLETTSWDDPRLNLSDFEGKKYAGGGKVGALEALAKKLMPLAEREANKEKFLNPSAIKNVMYHGTATDISQFKPKQANATFLTDNPNFAGGFADASENYLKQQVQNSLSNEELIKLNAKAAKLAKKTGESHIDLYHQMLKERLPTGQNIMPVHVQATNPFDYENAEHLAAIANPTLTPSSYAGINPNSLKHGDWEYLENPVVQRAIKKLGHDSFYVKEGGYKNLGVYDPNKIKSAIGNEGTYDINVPDITKKRGGKIKKK